VDAIWLGVKLALGLALGFWLIRTVRGFLNNLRFSKVGCTYECGEKPGTPTGWLTRDPHTADWLLWDVAHGVCLRMADSLALHEAIQRGDADPLRAWSESRGITLDESFFKCVEKDSLQWNTSNYSLDQFLRLAHEYKMTWQKQSKKPS
jgi:hypothetical protein